MRCHICNEEIDNPQDDPRIPGRLLPCGTCLDIIYDAMYEDEPDEPTYLEEEEPEEEEV